MVRRLVFLALLGLVGCGTGPLAPAAPTVVPTPTVVPSPTPVPPCSTRDGRLVYDALHGHAREWDDALKLAHSTPRMQLAPQIQHLQRIRRDVQAQEWPGCALGAQRLLVMLMDAQIEGFIAFLAQRPPEEHFARATALTAQFQAELGRIAR